MIKKLIQIVFNNRIDIERMKNYVNENEIFFLKHEYNVNPFDIKNESWLNTVEVKHSKNSIIREKTIIWKIKKIQNWIQIFMTAAQ